MDLTARWRELLDGPETAVPLDEAALLIAAHSRSDVDVGAQLARLDRLAAEVRGDGAEAVGELLFGRLHITGNTGDYGDPANSYLDRVLDRALGIPISLSVLMIEVGRRRGVHLEGVGMPGHFLVRDRDHPDTLIDAFGGGRRLDDTACRELLRSLVGVEPTLRPTTIPAAGAHGILARMLANLDHSFRSRQDRAGLGWVTTLRVAVPGQSADVRLEVAATMSELGRYDEAATVLRDVAQTAGLPEEAAAAVRSRAVAMQARLN